MLTGVACHATGLVLLSQITAFWQAALLFVLAESLLTTGAKALLASEPPTQTSPA